MVDFHFAVEGLSERLLLDDGNAVLEAICRIRSANSPAPFATTIGAAMVPGSYWMATASSVGLVTTTSALGTVCVSRLVTSCRCTARRRAMICGSPSRFRISSRTSWGVIRRSRSCRQN